MLDFPLMLRVKLPVVDRIQPQNNKFATGVGNNATGDSKLNDSPEVPTKNKTKKCNLHSRMQNGNRTIK